jgi:Cu-Zn family superoxide dismutase
MIAEPALAPILLDFVHRHEHVRSHEVNTLQARTVSAYAIGLSAAAILAACGGESEVAGVDVDAPPAARIGNVATARLGPVGNSSVAGAATFAEIDEGLRIEVTVTGLSPGQHGLHLHEEGDCSAPDASSAGSHFSPDEDPHGAPGDSADEHHAGDLGNLTVNADGSAQVTRDDPELSLIGEYGVVGKALIVHSGADDLVSQPSGESGTPVACGVIEWGTENTAPGTR